MYLKKREFQDVLNSVANFDFMLRGGITDRTPSAIRIYAIIGSESGDSFTGII